MLANQAQIVIMLEIADSVSQELANIDVLKNNQFSDSELEGPSFVVKNAKAALTVPLIAVFASLESVSTDAWLLLLLMNASKPLIKSEVLNAMKLAKALLIATLLHHADFA